jgi:hypothetical protein
MAEKTHEWKTEHKVCQVCDRPFTETHVDIPGFPASEFKKFLCSPECVRASKIILASAAFRHAD